MPRPPPRPSARSALAAAERGVAERRRLFAFAAEQAERARALEIEELRLRSERLASEAERAGWLARLARLRAERGARLRERKLISQEEAEILETEAKEAAAGRLRFAARGHRILEQSAGGRRGGRALLPFRPCGVGGRWRENRRARHSGSRCSRS